MTPRFVPALPHLALILALAACGGKPPASAPVPLPPLPPEASPSAAPPPPPATQPLPLPQPMVSWQDTDLTSGNWSYVTSPAFTYAAFGPDGDTVLFVLRCDRAKAQVSLGRASASTSPQPLRIVTTTQDRLLTGDPVQGQKEHLVATSLPARDGLLDAMALSRGRFAVETGGEATLYLPAWAEVTRVIEDCRPG